MQKKKRLNKLKLYGIKRQIVCVVFKFICGGRYTILSSLLEFITGKEF